MRGKYRKSPPQMKTAAKIAKAYDVPLWLIDGNVSPPLRIRARRRLRNVYRWTGGHILDVLTPTRAVQLPQHPRRR